MEPDHIEIYVQIDPESIEQWLKEGLNLVAALTRPADAYTVEIQRVIDAAFADGVNMGISRLSILVSALAMTASEAIKTAEGLGVDRLDLLKRVHEGVDRLLAELEAMPDAPATG